ncbi:MAG: nucleotidyltransferase domain-containing protein [Geminicoccaceae bacterium]|nr:nucleotidyltransferase domain-containing protein [Geminicoccaceae bacterium]
MNFTKFQPSIASDVRAAIDEKLDEIETVHEIRILFAVESGSRAWGFPSPDSDYDVRFVYAHPPDWYLSLTAGRNVIELPISADLDIGGWDIRKALNLLLKPNPVLLEWLSSPIRYRWCDEVTAELVSLARQITHRTACRHHYLSLGESQWRKHVGNATHVNFKKYFYILRPALALRWLRMHPEQLPPMNLQALVSGLDLDASMQARIAELLQQKMQAREIGIGRRIDEIDHLILMEFDAARAVPPEPVDHALQVEATALFRKIIGVA